MASQLAITGYDIDDSSTIVITVDGGHPIHLKNTGDNTVYLAGANYAPVNVAYAYPLEPGETLTVPRSDSADYIKLYANTAAGLTSRLHAVGEMVI